MNVFACSKLFRKLLSVLILPTALILFTTCEVGLGASVDTQPPELTLDYPAGNNLAIMNSFTLSGKAKDETYVGSVEIKLTCNEGLRKGTTYGPFAAKLSENVGDGNPQSWSALVNEPVIAEDGTRTYPIPDGSYTVSVTAYDSVKRTTSLSRVYNIDNTPPIVVLKRPINSDSFGQVVKVTGDISDANALKALYFTAYKKNSSGELEQVGTRVKKLNISGVGLEQIIAKKIQNPSNSEETELNAVYDVLYDSHGDPIQDVYFKIEVSDAAEEYNPKTPVRNGADAAETGNISNGYYIYKDIYSKIYSEGGERLTNSDLVNIFNGEYGDKERAGKITSYLGEKMIKTGTAVDETKTPKFSLSPKNSPTFEVSGYKYDSVANSFTDISNGSKIAVTVSPGRDQFQLDSDSVRLVLDECEANGTLVHQAANEIVLVESQEKINAETDQAKKTAMQAVRNEAFKEGDNIRITVSIGNRLSNRFYKVRVDGKDIEGHSIEASDGAEYGFKVVPTGAVPVIKITGGTEDYKKQNTTTVNYSGKISTSAAGVTLSCIITAQASNGSGTKIASKRIPVTPGAAPDFAWNVNIPSTTEFYNLAADGSVTTVPATINNNLVYIYTVSFTADDADGARSLPTERHIYVDTQNPIFDTSEPIKAKSGSDAEINIDDAAFASKWFTRNEITITGKAKDFDGGDNEVNKIQSYGIKIGTNAEFPFPTTNDTGNFTLLASFTEGINHVELSAYDLAGNKITKQFDIQVDNTAPALTSAAFVGNATTKENNISVKVEASDAKGTLQVSGLDKILIGKTPNFAESAALANVSASGASPYTVNNVNISSLPDGKHTLYARVIDKAGLVSQEAAIPNLIVDRTVPVIAYTYPAANAFVNKTIDLSGTVTDANIDASSAVKLYQRINPAGTWAEITGVTSTVTTSTTPVTWKITGINTTSLTDNMKYDFQVRITDKAGNTTPDTGDVRTLLINQNGDRPVVTFDTIKTSGLSTLGGKSINFSIEDDDGAVASVKVQVVKDGGGDPYKPDDASKWVDANYNHVTNKWSYEIPVVPPAKADGKYKIYFYIKDAKNEEFKTKENGTDGLQVPYMKDTTATSPVYAPVAFSVDTEAPTIDSVEVQFEGDSTYYPLSNGQKYGGKTNKKARFRIKARDTVTSDLNVMLEIQNFNAAEPTSLICSKSGGYYETAGLIDFGNVTVSEMKQISVTVKDNAEQSFSLSRTVIVDNAPPDSIKNVTPRPTDEVTGEVIMNGLVEDDANANSGIPPANAMKYYIPKFSEKDEDAKTIPDEAWKKEGLEQNSISWKLTLNNLTAYTSDTLYSGYQTSAGSGLYQLPVWFRVEDTVGNVGYIKGNEIKYNPDADKPRAVITYPVANEAGTTTDHVYNYVILGGTVSFTGSASDNEGIDSVWLQFDMDGDGDFDNDDTTLLSGISGVNVQTIPCTSPAQKGVKATGSVSWSYKLEVRNLTGLSYTDNGGKTLGVRAIAVDNDKSNPTSQLAGAWSDVLHISINNSVPSISAPKLVRYKEASYETIVQERAYDNDMFISGSNWRIEGEVYDNDGIREINVSGSQTTQEGWFKKKNSDDEKTYTYEIPINKDNGKWEIELEVYDKDSNSPKKSTAKYTVNIDNTAPDFKDGANENTLVLYKNEYGNSSPKLDSNGNFMRDSNGWFTIASKAGEAGSGFERAVFYALRIGSEKRVYNVMEEHGDNRRANRTKIESLTNPSSSADDGKLYINAEHLPALYKHSVTRADVYKISFTGLAANKNIRNGGLVKIGGSYHRINAVTGDTVSITPECAITFKEAEFIYGMSVDHNGESMNSVGNLSGDDGDGMVESYSKAGSDYIWTATFKSTHIPDGPIEMHVVVFDKAGNSRHSSVSTKVTNNPPRITSVKLSTDLNGNNSYDANESKTFYAFFKEDGTTGDTSKSLDVWTLDTAAYSGSSSIWTVKNGLQVEPEFVGGTSPYKYKFSKNAAALTTAEQTTTTATIQNKQQIILSNADIGTTGEDTDIYFRFSFWDSTEETNYGTNSQWTLLNAKLHQNIEDNVPPTAVINPFYWVSSEDNSLYDNKKDNGHIELEKDWKTASGYNSSATSGVSDKDPKVSGKIVVRGTVSDDVRLKEIKMAFDGIFVETPLSTYSNGAWSVYTPPANSGILAFHITDKELSQNGHTAEWELSVDTSKLTGVTGTDKAITVKAIHAAATTQNSSTPGTTQTTAKPGDTSSKPAGTTGYYRVDVVPYITGVKTSLSKTYAAEPSAFNRSATGVYSVRQGETIQIEGFNLGENVASVTVEGMSVTTLSNGTVGGKNVSNTISLSSAKSGNISLIVNGVEALNNKNAEPTFELKDDKYYVKTIEYNAEGNNLNNNKLTDDRKLFVWKFTDVVSDSGVRYPTMRVGKDNAQTVGFAYDSGAQAYNMYLASDFSTSADFTSDYSFTQWYDTGVAVDKHGRIYGTSQNGDSGGSGQQIYGAGKKFANSYFYAWNTKTSPGDANIYDSNWNTYNWVVPSGQSYAAYSTGRKKKAIENTYNGTSFNGQRVRNPKIVTGDNGDAYLVYYDSSNDQIRFRYGNVSGSLTTPTFTGAFNDHNQSNFGSGVDYQVIAGGTSASSPTAPTGNSTSLGGTNATRSGEYSAVGLSTKTDAGYVSGTAVAAWYDVSNQRLLFSYNTQPKSASSAAQWGINTIAIDNDFAGWYVDMIVDGNGGIHIAYYGASAGDLKYAYLSDYKDTEPDIVTVDSYLSVGSNISIDVLENTVGAEKKYIPYISYFMSAFTKTNSSVRVAWLNTTDYSKVDGVKKDQFTGDWEVMTIPSNQIPLDYTIGIGIKKNNSNKNSALLGYGTKNGLQTASLE